MTLPPLPRTILWIALLKFVYILDFLMLMPLGPDVAAALAFPPDQLGWASTAYMVGSILSGTLAVGFIDRLPRKPVMLWGMILFSLSTLAVIAAKDLPTLLALRLATGFFGGPVVAAALAAVVDLTPPAQRGTAMGRVMAGFSLAAIVGVPAMLELSRLAGWAAPFAVVAALGGVLVVAMALWFPHTCSAGEDSPDVSMGTLLRRGPVRLACLVQGLSHFASFLIVPVFATFFLLNLGVPRDRLGTLYLVGGIAAFLVMQAGGWLVDRIGPMRVVVGATGAVVVGASAFLGESVLPPLLLFVAFMAGNAARNVSLAAALSNVPSPHERGGFMALKGVVEDVSIAVAALVSSLVLATENQRLTGTFWLGLLAIGVSLAVPLWLARLAAPRSGGALSGDAETQTAER
ncbi:MFS transporter [Tahibacter amnicola]|uniref:MFS transporter n=1 Tax=Tahibacter amnicola TaxID=2976241 RepID=A0ABY6BFG6_9GAMM|nr:MFS transporter [Tahibacter amnicola]UXI66612.1 MFS transporter [Tahibacter amnicola]